MNKNLKYLFLILLISATYTACVKEKFETSDIVDISFSVDTLHFDTVFTQIGSATRFFKLYNNESLPIEVSSVYMKSGSSRFRLNVDGLEGDRISDVYVAPNDSIYIFVEVTINPDQPLSESPFVIEDHVVFEINGSTRQVLVDAWGQNANYVPNQFNRTKVYRLDCNTELVWDDPKPYVIYGLLYIDSCVLKIAAGTQIHVHGGIGRTSDIDGNTVFFNDGTIVIGSEGSLVCEGTVDEPIVFQGDRLEPQFDDVPGQWNGIRFLTGSRGNRFENTTIKNCVFGAVVDSMGELTLDKAQIFNTTVVGIFGFHVSSISATNSLFHSSSAIGALFRFGGDLDFDHCTFANFGNDKEAVFLSNHFCYDFPECSNWPTNELNANFTNCIVNGSNKDEFWLSAIPGASVNLSIANSIIRIEDLLNENNFPNFMEDFTTNSINWTSSDSLFIDENNGDFHLDTLSIAEGKGQMLLNVTTDLEGNMRDPVRPDIGCYEYQY